jgi:hypothetical protein
MAKAKVQLKLSEDGDWPEMEESQVEKILLQLQAEPKAEGVPVYVAGGRLRLLDESGSMTSREHPAAQPYAWPIAHDVRPAALSLGARGCADCHDSEAPIFFARVAVDSPLLSDRAESWAMYRFQQSLDTAYVADLARSFQYRPWLKVSLTAAAAILGLLALAYLVPALQGLSTAAGTGRWRRLPIGFFGVAAAAVSIWSGFPALLSGERLTGYSLVLHVGVAPVFAVAAVLVALFWAHRNSFGPADWKRVRRPFRRQPADAATPRLVVLRKVFFWLAVVAVIPTVISATLALFPLLASVYQETLFLVHRYSVTALVAAIVPLTLLALVTWVRRSRGPGTASPIADPGRTAESESTTSAESPATMA